MLASLGDYVKRKKKLSVKVLFSYDGITYLPFAITPHMTKVTLYLAGVFKATQRDVCIYFWRCKVKQLTQRAPVVWTRFGNAHGYYVIVDVEIVTFLRNSH